MKLQSNKNLEDSIFTVLETWASDRSKDPHTQVGACIYDYSSGAMFLGYNGFPKGISDTSERWDRPYKYSLVIHAEVNSILKALPSLGGRMACCVLFTTHQPCSNCMLLIIQCGIKKVIYLTSRPDPLSSLLASEAGIEVVQHIRKDLHGATK